MSLMEKKSYALDVDALIERVNQQIMAELHIHQDDPIVAFIHLNQALMKAHVEQVRTLIKESGHEMSVALQQERDASKTLQANMLDKTGDYMKNQILDGLNAWEAKFNENADARFQWMRWETWISKASALLVLGFLLWQLGSWIGNKIVPDPPKSPSSVNTQHRP